MNNGLVVRCFGVGIMGRFVRPPALLLDPPRTSEEGKITMQIGDYSGGHCVNVRLTQSGARITLVAVQGVVRHGRNVILPVML